MRDIHLLDVGSDGSFGVEIQSLDAFDVIFLFLTLETEAIVLFCSRAILLAFMCIMTLFEKKNLIKMYQTPPVELN